MEESLVNHTEPCTKLGDIINLGEHLLMYGSATVTADADHLFGGRVTDMIFTDLPYNVDYHGGTEEKLSIKKVF